MADKPFPPKLAGFSSAKESNFQLIRYFCADTLYCSVWDKVLFTFSGRLGKYKNAVIVLLKTFFIGRATFCPIQQKPFLVFQGCKDFCGDVFFVLV